MINDNFDTISSEVVEKEATELWTVLSSEIRNSFQSIIGFSNLILENGKSTEAEIRDMIILIQSAAQKNHDLLDSALHFYKSDHDEWKKCKNGNDIQKIIENVINFYRHQVQHKGINIKYKLESIPKIIIAESIVKFIIHNLLSTMIKQSKKGETIEISNLVKSDQLKITIKLISTNSSASNLTLIKNNLTQNSKNIKYSLHDLDWSYRIKLCEQFINRLGGNLKVEFNQNVKTKLLMTLPYNY